MAHQQHFRTTSLQSLALLELIYTNVLDPTSYTEIDGSRCYPIIIIIIIFFITTPNIFAFIQ